MVAKVMAVEMYGMMPRRRAGDGLALWIRSLFFRRRSTAMIQHRSMKVHQQWCG